MKKSLALLIAVVMIFSLLTGCSGAGNATEPATPPDSSGGAVPEGIQTGTSVSMFSGIDVTTQQVPGANPPAAWLYMSVYDTLFFYPDGDPTNLQGLLAKDWTVSDDGLTWIINLQDNVTFVNGNKLTADSVVGTFNFTKQYQGASFSQVETYEATGEYQVTFHLRAPMPEFMGLFAIAHTSIMDYTLLEKNGPTPEACYQASSGPYYIDSYAAGDNIVLKANENYWNKERMPHIETITCKIIGDPNTAATTLNSGEMDHGQIADYNLYETLQGNSKLQISQDKDMMRTLWFNCQGPSTYLKNSEVRKALSMMIDMEQACLAATGGYGTVQKNAFNDTFAYDDGRKYDPDGALAILKEQGIDPKAITLVGITDMSTAAYFKNIQSQFAKYGVNFTFDVKDTPAVITLGIKGEWDVWAESGGMGNYSYFGPVQMLLGSHAVFNVFNDDATRDQVHQIIDKAMSEKTFDEEKADLEELLQVLGENHAYIGSIRPPLWNVFSGRIQNIVIDQGLSFWLPWYSYVAE